MKIISTSVKQTICQKIKKRHYFSSQKHLFRLANIITQKNTEVYWS